MCTNIPHRSILVTPAIRPDRFLKGIEMGTDITLIDFEDSVPPEYKAKARKDGLDFLSSEKEKRHAFAIRINKMDLQSGLEDLIKLLESNANPDVIIIPKVESPYDVLTIERLLSTRLESVQYYATIETAEGVINIFDIAKASPSLTALILGSADLADDLGSTMGWDGMLYARSRIAIAASYAGIDAIDTPFFNIDDPEGLRIESERVRDMGFTGKIAIHPSQIDTLNQVFSPDKNEIHWAVRVLKARSMTQDNICVVDGKMIGPPMVSAARRILDIAQKINLYPGELDQNQELQSFLLNTA